MMGIFSWRQSLASLAQLEGRRDRSEELEMPQLELCEADEPPSFHKQHMAAVRFTLSLL